MNKDNWPDYYWEHLAYLEASCLENNFKLVKDWDSLAQKCMLLAIKAPFLVKSEKNKLSLKVASAFMKRTMSDFRGAWLLLNIGYPYQAACVAASLYENSLIVNCISDSDDLATKALECRGGDIPWGPKKLAQMAAQKDLYGVIKNDQPNNVEYKKAWELCYHNYKLLCKMKHPTIQQLKEEVKNTSIDNGQFVVVPKPFEMSFNTPVFEIIMIIMISRLFSAAKCFAMALNLPAEDDSNVEFLTLCNEVYSLLIGKIESSDLRSLPIEVNDFRLN